eukprot:m.30968 g.30968  ORF g.30968 m.30968 type:complete len:672 (+) comp4759_c0_seq1:244-2259(+)
MMSDATATSPSEGPAAGADAAAVANPLKRHRSSVLRRPPPIAKEDMYTPESSPSGTPARSRSGRDAGQGSGGDDGASHHNGDGHGVHEQHAHDDAHSTSQHYHEIKHVLKEQEVASEMRMRTRVYQNFTSLTGLITTTSTFMFVGARNSAPGAEFETFASVNLVLTSVVLIAVIWGTAIIVLQKNKAGIRVSRKQYRQAIVGWHEGRHRRHRAVLSIVLSLPCVLLSSAFFLISTVRVREENYVASGIMILGAVVVFASIARMEREFVLAEKLASPSRQPSLPKKTTNFPDKIRDMLSPVVEPISTLGDMLMGTEEDNEMLTEELETVTMGIPLQPTDASSTTAAPSNPILEKAPMPEDATATVAIEQQIRHLFPLTVVSVLQVLITRVMFAEARDGAQNAEYQRTGVGNMMVSILIHIANIYATAVLILQQHKTTVRISTKRYRSASLGWQRLTRQRKRATMIIAYSVPMVLYAFAFFMLGGIEVNVGNQICCALFVVIATYTWISVFRIGEEFKKADHSTKDVRRLLAWTNYFVPAVSPLAIVDKVKGRTTDVFLSALAAAGLMDHHHRSDHKKHDEGSGTSSTRSTRTPSPVDAHENAAPIPIEGALPLQPSAAIPMAPIAVAAVADPVVVVAESDTDTHADTDTDAIVARSSGGETIMRRRSVISRI